MTTTSNKTNMIINFFDTILFTMQIVRSNQNGIMARLRQTDDTYSYGVYDVRSNQWKHCGSRKTAARGWQRYFANSRQFSTPNGVNHRYLFAD